MNKLLIAAIIIVMVTTVSYSLYCYNYNEAKDAMSLVMPDYMLAYAQPIEDNWNNIPSHAVNGEISIYASFIGDIPNPGGLSPLDVTFDIKNVTTIRMGIYENDTNFSFNPFEENASVLWQIDFRLEDLRNLRYHGNAEADPEVQLFIAEDMEEEEPELRKGSPASIVITGYASTARKT